MQIPNRLAMLILAGVLLTGCASSGRETAPLPETAAVLAENSEMSAVEESVPAEPSQVGDCALTVSRLMLSYPGMTENVYCGTAPVEQVCWESSAPEIVSVENGVVTAEAKGSAEITAAWGEETLSCTVECLTDSQEDFMAMDDHLLENPIRELPSSQPGTCTYFDDAGFVGDSVTYQLLYTPGREERIGSPVALFRRSASVKGFVDRFWNLNFRGEDMPLEDAIAESGVKRVFIMLGSNDMGYQSVEEVMDNWDVLITRIQEKTPQVEIYVESILPSGTGNRVFNEKNEKIARYNAALKEFAQKRGLHYLELAAYFEDSLGRLARCYSSDGDVHITETAVYKWSEILRLFAQRQGEGENK